ncbi:hypothetical protein TNCV_1107011 [Trichonephila clavipes]|nr:hypothetical protein TNCV_1107011 [Trichonephila clavipes]
MVMSETHSEKRKFGKAGESSANKKARREVSKKSMENLPRIAYQMEYFQLEMMFLSLQAPKSAGITGGITKWTFPPERHIQITSENFIDFTFKRIKYSPDKEPTFKEITISREQWAEMIKKYGAIENAAIDNMFQCMDFLTAYKTFCEGPIENTLPSSLDVSLGQQYLTQILKKSICSLLNEKGLKQPQTFAEELWGIAKKHLIHMLHHLKLMR